MASNPVLDDDDVLLIPGDEEEVTDKDLPTPSSNSQGSVYPRWPVDANRLPIGVTPIPATTLNQAPLDHQVIEMHGADHRGWQTRRLRGVLNPVSADPPVSFTWAYVASCVVYWCFCLVIGGIAYVIAAIGENHAYDGNIVKAKNWRNVSFAVSGAGVVFGIVYIVLVATVVLPIYYANQQKGLGL